MDCFQGSNTRFLGILLTLFVSLYIVEAPGNSPSETRQKASRTEYCETGTGGTDVHTRAQVAPDNPPLKLFRGSSNGPYHSYRIPAIVRTPTGTLIAFCEGRKHSSEDWGDIDVVYRRSFDNGASWTPHPSMSPSLLFSKHADTCGNPTPVVDWDTGAIWIFMSHNDSTRSQFGHNGLDRCDEWCDRRVYYNVSYNDGATWDDLRNRTLQLVPPSYGWDAVGPGTGIQVKHGPYTGRLIIPAIGRNIYSDDHGATWHYSLINPGTSEGTITELCNGDWMKNDRATGNGPFGGEKRRQVSISSDYGASWSAWESSQELLDPLCQASIFRYNEDYPHRLIFINPASTTVRHPMVVRISYDDGATWPIQRTLDPSRGGYSSLTKTADFMIASLQEYGADAGHHSIVFRKFNLSWILNGTPEPIDGPPFVVFPLDPLKAIH